MTSTATVLAYLPSPPQGVWYVGPLALRAYALCIIVGIIVAIWWGDRRWVARGGRAGTVLDIAVWAVPFGLIGGRLYHVATDWQKYFGEGADPIDALKIWEGGLGIWGAVAFGAVGAWIGCRRRGIPLPAFGDALAPAILLAQAIGRLGNWFNQELYGRETTVPWGLEIYERTDDAGRSAPGLIDGVSTGEVAFVVHPTFLYELLWNVAIVVLLVLVDRKFAIGHGRLFALYVAGYCAGRFWIELMRADTATEIAGIRVNTFTSGIVFVLAVAYVIFARKGREAPETLDPSASKSDDAAVSSAATGEGAAGKDGDAGKDDTDTERTDRGEQHSNTRGETPDPDKSDSAGKVGNGTPGTSKGETQ
ncbi:prolipoprotein diacylglyceryl transferase [Rhodococcus sp. HNM0563]|uniref:prolipoprotein diacylglyceryl transferase n=1 Tax=Rhodococcus sp. HNM0563 TaxID=2716339 RepID=UPI00146F5C89|nr:prolipoprotein diacylglyceryl transferase [Rhodococcus sp. HNM0563]